MAKGKWKATLLAIQGIVGHKTAPDWDFIYEHSTIKNPNYNVGDRVALPDGRVYRYAKAGGALTSQKYTCANASKLAMNYHADFLIASAAVVGAKSVTITVAAGNTYGPGDTYGSATGILAEDELRGGYISLYRGQDRQNRGIVGNTALAVGGVSITIYLDASLVTAMQAGDYIEVLNCPYACIMQNNSSSRSVVGVAASVVANGEYFWVQTWGICRITPQAGALGAVGDEREFCSKNNGVISLYTRIVTETTSAQHLGFLVEQTASAAGEAAPFINLQINP